MHRNVWACTSLGMGRPWGCAHHVYVSKQVFMLNEQMGMGWRQNRAMQLKSMHQEQGDP